MRKIANIIGYTDNFEKISSLIIKNTDSTVTKYDISNLVPEIDVNGSTYSDAELIKIHNMNRILSCHGLPIMTKEESDYFVDPLNNKQKLNTTEQDLQKLAGFNVEKIVTYNN